LRGLLGARRISASHWRRYDREHYDKRAGQELGPDEEGSGFLMKQLAAPDSLEDQVIERVEADRRLGRLKPDERESVELQGAGFSYAEIAEHKGWTYTKVHRSVREGRGRLRATEVATR
jgi:DNA-directed RNA polymerase specialized sigma24 family protein